MSGRGGHNGKLRGRFWPTGGQRPGESIADWCRRLDELANAADKTGAGLGVEAGQVAGRGSQARDLPASQERNDRKEPR